MGRSCSALGLLLALGMGSCGGGGGNTGGSGGGSGNSLTGDLLLLSHEPAADAVQVPVTATVELVFDGAVVEESLADPGTWLQRAGSSEPVAGTFAVLGNGRTVRFLPAQPLEEETDYTMHVSPLTADSNGRILERDVAFTFRTFDQRPPAVTNASVAANANGVSRTGAILVTFREPIAPASVQPTSVTLKDTWGGDHAVALVLQGAVLQVRPVADLAGTTNFVLSVRGGAAGVTDRAGNPLSATWTLPFRTEADTTGPSALASWPNALVDRSPAIQPLLRFDESVDPASVEPGAIQFSDEFGSFVAFTVQATADQRGLRLRPAQRLHAGRNYSLYVPTGPGALCDVSGNTLRSGVTVAFAVGGDEDAPVLASSLPAAGARRVSVNVAPQLVFAEGLDPERVSVGTVRLLRGGQEVAVSVTQPAPERVLITPAQDLAPATEYTLAVTGGHDGVRDLAGNPLAAELRISFETAADASAPLAIVQPPHGSVGVPVGSVVSVVFDQPVDVATVTPATVHVLHGTSAVAGTLEVARGDRVVRFAPTGGWTAGENYRLLVRGGPGGVREVSGNWLRDDLDSDFRIGFAADGLAPTVTVTLNGIDDLRKDLLTVPPSGFTVDVRATDAIHYSLDAGTFEVVVQGDAAAPGPDAIFAGALVGTGSLRWRVARDQALAPGSYRVFVRCRDLSGNVGTSTELAFRVAAPSDDALPFERVQVVWTRFELDRDGNGRADFEDDLHDLGLLAAGDPRGTNARMTQVLRDAVLAQANLLFARSPAGATLGDDSVAVRLCWRRPLGVAAMQIAVGGRDPEGPRGRTYGDDSTGVLGRAWFDYRNGALADLNIGVRPGLGVFPGEMFLYQAGIHRQVYPSFVTSWARRFLALSPHLGGTPAGAHALDAIVLAPDFAYANAPAEQRARYNAVFLAADDWAAAMGTILAHEIGHSVGLVATGPNPTGLHGDESLHDLYAQGSDVMAAAVSYESLISLTFAFRDLDLSYLRQRVLMK